MTLLVVESITVAHGRMPAVHDLSLTVAPGEFVALLGRNGAGKTTTLRAVAGLHRIGAGSITLGGERLGNRPGWQVARRGVAMVLEGARVFGEQSVAENLALGSRAAYDPVASRRRVDELTEAFPVLRTRESTRAGLLSGGERQQLAVAQALAALPRVLLLDEPSAGLAPVIVAQLFALLDRIRREDCGPALLVAEQMVAPVLRVADRALVLDGGRIVRSDAASRLRGSGDLIETYMGTGTRAG